MTMNKLEPLEAMRSRVQSTGRVVLSVVIPVFNEERFIGDCLRSLEQQSIGSDKFEVIVVDNGSADRTLQTVAEFGGRLHLQVLPGRIGNISSLRNQGASVAVGSFLAFLDADCFPNSTWLGDAMKLLRLGDGGVIGAFYTIPEASGWVAKAWYRDMPTLKHGSISYVPSGNLFVSRNLFLRLGGFDGTIQTSEDFEFCQRVKSAGYSVQGFPKLSVVHAGTPQTCAEFYRKQRWHGNGVRTAFVRDMLHRGFARTVALTAYTVVGLVIAVLSLPVAMVTHRFTLLLAAPILLVGCSMALAMRAAASRNKWLFIPHLTILYLLYSLARALSLIGLDGKRSARTVSTGKTGMHVSVGTVPPVLNESGHRAPEALLEKL
jgi:glycosyltransferase involved in cell wall biosynthesis